MISWEDNQEAPPPPRWTGWVLALLLISAFVLAHLGSGEPRPECLQTEARCQ